MRRALRLLPLALTVAGLFAMHGLADHGTGGDMVMGAPTTAHHAVVAPAAPGHGDAMAMGLCVALLVAAGVAVGAAGRGRTVVALAPWPHVVVRATPARARSPDLHSLGMCRC